MSYKAFERAIGRLMMIVGVLGLGYVGLPLCREFVRGGCEVIGFDIDQAKIEQLQKSKSYIKHISDESIS